MKTKPINSHNQTESGSRISDKEEAQPYSKSDSHQNINSQIEELKKKILSECSDILKERIKKMDNYEGDEFWSDYTFFKGEEDITNIAIDKAFQEAQSQFKCSKCNDTLDNTQLICWTCHCQEKDKVEKSVKEDFYLNEQPKAIAELMDMAKKTGKKEVLKQINDLIDKEKDEGNIQECPETYHSNHFSPAVCLRNISEYIEKEIEGMK